MKQNFIHNQLKTKFNFEGDAQEQLCTTVKSMDKSEINYYDSGSFDHIIKLCKDGGYYIIAGSNGHCKTTMLLNMIKEIASINKEETIALFSLEMSQKKLGNDLKKMDEVGSNSCENIIVGSSVNTILDMKKQISEGEHKNNKKIHIVALDYLQIIKGENDESVANELKKGCEQTKKVIICTSQTKAEFKSNHMFVAERYLAGSIGYGRNASGIIALGRNKLDLYVTCCKNRYGRVSDKELNYDITHYPTITGKVASNTNNSEEDIQNLEQFYDKMKEIIATKIVGGKCIEQNEITRLFSGTKICATLTKEPLINKFKDEEYEIEKNYADGYYNDTLISTKNMTMDEQKEYNSGKDRQKQPIIDALSYGIKENKTPLLSIMVNINNKEIVEASTKELSAFTYKIMELV